MRCLPEINYFTVYCLLFILIFIDLVQIVFAQLFLYYICTISHAEMHLFNVFLILNKTFSVQEFSLKLNPKTQGFSGF